MSYFIYHILAPTVGIFYLPFYPATILLFIYISYSLVKKRVPSTWAVLGLSLFSLLPTLLMILFAVLEITFSTGYRYGVIFFYFGVGIVINLISCALLVIYFFQISRKNTNRAARKDSIAGG